MLFKEIFLLTVVPETRMHIELLVEESEKKNVLLSREGSEENFHGYEPHLDIYI